MRKQIAYCTVALLWLLTALCGCQRPTMNGAELINANRLYEEGLFEEATTAYERLVQQGTHDGVVYYNLGNAYYRQGDLGRAILNYRRAQMVSPRDDDIMENLSLARSQTVDRMQDGNPSLVYWLVKALHSGMTNNEMAWALMTLWLLSGLLGVTWMLRPGRRELLGYALAITVTLSVLSAGILGLALAQQRRHPSAVLLSQQVDARSGPGPDYIIEFTLHAGAEVRILGEQAQWVRIALPGDLEGWVTQESLERIQTP